jgi:hypothetical protein
MKTRTVVLVLILMALLITTSGSPRAEARASTTERNVLSGGRYILSIDTPTGQQETGYQWIRERTEATPAVGCCCKSYLPCTRK